MSINTCILCSSPFTHSNLFERLRPEKKRMCPACCRSYERFHAAYLNPPGRDIVDWVLSRVVPVPRWQPMKTAPKKNGVKVLLAFEDGDFVTGVFNPTDKRWWNTDTVRRVYAKPTGWMPLPPVTNNTRPMKMASAGVRTAKKKPVVLPPGDMRHRAPGT